MVLTLVDALHDALTADFIDRTSALVDERPSNTRQALERIVGVLLDELIERASSLTTADRLLDLINRAGQREALADLSSGVLTFEALLKSGERPLASILAGRVPELVEQIAATCGLRLRSAATMLTLMTPVVLGMIGEEVVTRRLDASGLASLLADLRQPLAQPALS